MAEAVKPSSRNKLASKRALQRGFLLVMLLTTASVFAETLLDPTRPPATFSLQKEDHVSAPAAGPLLQSVLISPARKVAVISGQTVKLGEYFGDSRVVSITEGEVVLRSGKASQTLRLFPDVQKRLTSSSVRTQSSTQSGTQPHSQPHSHRSSAISGR